MLSGNNAYSSRGNCFLASINSILSFKTKFDPMVDKISFFVFRSPFANRSFAVEANSKVCSACFNWSSNRGPKFLIDSSNPDFSFSNSTQANYTRIRDPYNVF
jgi:hypothetical protein